jgi:hypothetical protein
VEARDDGRNINIVMHVGAKTGADTVRQDPTQHQWVKKHTEPQDSLMRGKKNKYSRKQDRSSSSKYVSSTSITQHTQKVPMYEIPLSMDHTSKVPPIAQVSTIKTFLQSCVKLLNDPSSVKVLQNMLEICNTVVEGKLEQKTVNHLHTRRRTSREFRLNANIGDFNMGDIILDLGSEVNVLPKKTWKCMGEPTLGYSPIQLKLENQHRVLPIGRLKGVTVDLMECTLRQTFK